MINIIRKIPVMKLKGQYNVALAITSTIKGASQIKLYKE